MGGLRACERGATKSLGGLRAGPRIPLHRDYVPLLSPLKDPSLYAAARWQMSRGGVVALTGLRGRFRVEKRCEML